MNFTFTSLFVLDTPTGMFHIWISGAKPPLIHTPSWRGVSSISRSVAFNAVNHRVSYTKTHH